MFLYLPSANRPTKELLSCDHQQATEKLHVHIEVIIVGVFERRITANHFENEDTKCPVVHTLAVANRVNNLFNVEIARNSQCQRIAYNERNR